MESGTPLARHRDRAMATEYGDAKPLPALGKPRNTLSYADPEGRAVAVTRDESPSPGSPDNLASGGEPVRNVSAAPGQPPNSREPPMASGPERPTRTAPVAEGCHPAPADDAPLVSPQPRDPRRYRLLAEHGRGGLGRVYRARDRELGRDVALKELLQHTHRSEARFFREALITARLEHPGIVPVHEAGRWPDGTPFYSMKLVAGRPLSDLLSDATTPDARLALLPHLIAVADAIAYAHDRQTIHRDLKPSNVIVGDFGETIVIDWGLAKELTATEDDAADGPYRAPAKPELTAAGSVMGTPAYMSSEQARGDTVDTRTDVYSLGAMLFELCIGAVPGQNAKSTDLRAKLRRIPDDLTAIILKSLASNPADRYPDAGAFAADLRAYDAGARIAAREYSLVAMLRHWFRRHKRLAISIVVPTILMSILGALALREIVSRGNRATAAKRDADSARLLAERERTAAEQERDLAVRSEAALLLEKDPTRARDLLASRQNDVADLALLKARAHGASPADRVISMPPYKIWRAEPDPELETLVIVASDNKLRKINLSTGLVEVVESVVEPPLLVRHHGGLTYARRGKLGPEIVRASNPSRPISIGNLPHVFDSQEVAAADGIYLLDTHGHLFRLSEDGQLLLLRGGIRGMARYRDGLLACTKKSDLLQIEHGRAARVGGCQHDGGRYALGTYADGYVAQSSPASVILQRGERVRELQLQEPNEFIISASGLVVGIDRSDRPWYLTSQSDTILYGPPTDSRPTSLGADGGLAAWGYGNGVARVRDARSAATWTFVGHGAPIAWIFISEQKQRVVTVGGPEVRVWSLPPFTLRPLDELPCGPYNIVPSPDTRRVAFDCVDGKISVIDRDQRDDRIRTLHQHDGLSFGVTWRGDEVCSSGWDGRVLCTGVSTRKTTEIAHHARPVRFVHSNGHVLVYAVEDGGVWIQPETRSQPKLLYRHEAEPYRVAVSTGGDVASGAQDGGVIAYYHATQTVHSMPKAHNDRVSAVLWRDEKLFTSSWDGSVRLWSAGLVPYDAANSAGPLREVALTNSGWVASVSASRLWLHSGTSDLYLDTGPRITDLSISADGRYMGAMVSGDLIVYDLRERALAAVRVGDASADCGRFVDSAEMFVCGSLPESKILSIAVNTLPFVRLNASR